MSTGNFVVVDVQPSYQQWMSRMLVRQTLEEVEARLERGETVWMLFNNEDLSGDTLNDVQELWREAGMSDKVLDRCQWVEKEFAFLRGWMDIGIDEDEIVAALKLLKARKVWDSRSIPVDELEAISAQGAESSNPLFDCYQLDSSGLGDLRTVEICGGSRDECLLETELWLSSRGVTSSRVDHLTY